MLRAQGIAGLFGVLTYLHGYRVPDVAARGTNAEGVGAGLSEPLAVGLIEAGEVAALQLHGEHLALAGLQLACLGESFQFLG